MAGLTYEECALSWREYVYNALIERGCNPYSPVRGKKFMKGVGKLGKTGFDTPIATAKGVVGRDYRDTCTADIVFVNFIGAKDVSIGTVGEIAWAWANRVPVILVMEDEGNVHDHLFIQEMHCYRTPDLDEGIALAAMMLTPSLV
jgi:nucleoside 2-deoxyribosyltransferase